jgi:IS5 family transposase
MSLFDDFFRQRAVLCGTPPLSKMIQARDPWNLDFPLFQWSPLDVFTLRNAVESVAIFGELGAAKTTGSAAWILLKYLQILMGGLVCCVKPGDRELIEGYAKLTGRSDSLIRISTGTIVDATIIHAPSSTKNSSGKRDPEMHQVKKGNQWYFGAKAHIGVDSKETVVHSVATTAASVADKHMLPDLLHGDERKVWGDGGYQGQSEAIHAAAPKAQDMTCRRTKYNDYVDEQAKRKNTTKARVRAKVEYPFRILKRVFGFTKVRYRGIWKNHQWLCAAFALVNLYQHRNRLAPQRA